MDRMTTAPHGTAALLEFAATLHQRADNLRSFFDYAKAANDLLACKEIIERLAPLDHDVEVELGEN